MFDKLTLREIHQLALNNPDADLQNKLDTHIQEYLTVTLEDFSKMSVEIAKQKYQNAYEMTLNKKIFTYNVTHYSLEETQQYILNLLKMYSDLHLIAPNLILICSQNKISYTQLKLHLKKFGISSVEEFTEMETSLVKLFDTGPASHIQALKKLGSLEKQANYLKTIQDAELENIIRYYTEFLSMKEHVYPADRRNMYRVMAEFNKRNNYEETHNSFNIPQRHYLSENQIAQLHNGNTTHTTLGISSKNTSSKKRKCINPDLEQETIVLNNTNKNHNANVNKPIQTKFSYKRTKLTDQSSLNYNAENNFFGPLKDLFTPDELAKLTANNHKV